jgi:NADPH-dependent 2,4-dienoyl-CoA reductase/sulfur reductase-like enzyme/pSer/pThr/pTyr-binding forkhead associated (FHA) protein
LSQKRYIIIGDGAAGTTAAQSLRAHDKGATIAILSDDPHAAYFRAALTNYLLGELREEQIWAVPPSFYDEYAIHRALVRVAQVDTKRSLLWLAQGGRPIGYDSLILASGSRARPPTFEGAWLPGIMTMRTLQDVHRVMDLIKLKGLKTAVVVGGGPLALEWAHGLSHRGVNVLMVVREQKFLPGAIDNVSSDLLLARLKSAGVQVRMGDEVMAATPGPSGRVGGIVLKSGERVACELVCAAIGVICNSEFLGPESGIVLAKNGGIEVDDQMRTSVPNVYAAGDVAAYHGKLLQLWEPARMQARVVASTIQGRGDKWTPGVHYMATRLYDLDCASIGDVAVTPQGAEELVDFPQRTGKISYRKLCVKDNRLVGALMFGDKEAHVRRWGRGLKRLIDTKADISKIKAELLDPSFDLAGWLHTNELTEKPKVAKPPTMTSNAVGQMKGTHAINLADLPPLPAMITRSKDGTASAAAPSSNGAAGAPLGPGPATADAAARVAADLAGAGGIAAAFADAAPPPQVTLEGPPGRIQVQPPSAIVGRDPASAIPLNDPLVSWRHAEFTISGQYIYLRDLGSGTGTWINNMPVSSPKSLRDGDRIRIGSTELTIRVVLTGADGSRVSADAASLQKAGTGEPKPHLDVRNGRALGLSFELVLDMITIGRDPASIIRLDDESIDWRHAWIRKTPAGWDIADAESHGVTKKNGIVLAPNQWVPMQPGDNIEIGEVGLTYSVRPSAVLNALLAPASVSYGPRGEPAHHPSAPPGAPQYGATPSAPPYAPPQAPAYGAPPQGYGAPPPAYGAPPPAYGHHPSQLPPQRAGSQVPAAPGSNPGSNRGRARISVRQGPGQGAVAELADVTVIGSHPQHATLVLPDPRLGPRHVEIMRHADGFYARDLGSQTGTSCRGHQLGPQPFKLHNGDVLILGQNVALLFEASA